MMLSARFPATIELIMSFADLILAGSRTMSKGPFCYGISLRRVILKSIH
jgi:hypothetical protein